MRRNAAKYDTIFQELLQQGVFTVNADGHVYRHKVRRNGVLVLLPYPRRADFRTTDGYHRVGVYFSGRKITIAAHRVVWIANMGTIDPDLEVNHRNGVRDDNRMANLELLTPGDNLHHCYRHLGRSVAGESNPRHRLSAADVTEVRSLYRQGLSQRQLGIVFGVASSTIQAVVSQRNWKAAGYEWGPFPLEQV